MSDEDSPERLKSGAKPKSKSFMTLPQHQNTLNFSRRMSSVPWVFGAGFHLGSREKSPTLVGGGSQKAIDFGEYDPQFLAGFAEWHELGRHSQFQLIRKALENRRKHLLTQWAEINNVLDFSKKPYLQKALRNIESQWKKLAEDREKLFIEYSK